MLAPPAVCPKQPGVAVQVCNFPIFQLFHHSGSSLSSTWPPTVCIVEKINNTMCAQLGDFSFESFT